MERQKIRQTDGETESKQMNRRRHRKIDRQMERQRKIDRQMKRKKKTDRRRDR